MKLTIVSTDEVINVNGADSRVFVGTSENGVECLVFVSRIAVPLGSDQSEFEDGVPEAKKTMISINGSLDLKRVDLN